MRGLYMKFLAGGLAVCGHNMASVVLVLCTLSAVLVAAWASPNAHLITEDISARYSNDIYEDARLDVPQLVRKYGYPLEEHRVTTSDGYILTMHRIPHGRDNHNRPGPRPVVFVQHGLLCSSADWVIMGPGKGLAYLLAEAGYDVWMGNARGNYYSRTHLYLRPDAILNTDYWNFSWHHIGCIDLPTMIDYALSNTGRGKCHYIGHSQGTTSFFVMTSEYPEYNDKIISMHALAPVAFMGNIESLFMRMIAPFSHSLEIMSSWLGMGEFLPNNLMMTWAGQQLCRDTAITQGICTNFMFLIGGRNEDQLNATMLPVILGHTPAGSSTKQFAHYGQGINSDIFRRYDYGSWLANYREHGQRYPQNYDVSKITAPVFLHYSDSDPMAHVNDVIRLNRNLGRPAGLFRVQDPNFSHLDFMWAIDAKSLVYDRVMNLVRAMDE